MLERVAPPPDPSGVRRSADPPPDPRGVRRSDPRPTRARRFAEQAFEAATVAAWVVLLGIAARTACLWWRLL